MAKDTDKQGWLILYRRQKLVVESTVCRWLQQKTAQDHAADLTQRIYVANNYLSLHESASKPHFNTSTERTKSHAKYHSHQCMKVLCWSHPHVHRCCFSIKQMLCVPDVALISHTNSTEGFQGHSQAGRLTPCCCRLLCSQLWFRSNIQVHNLAGFSPNDKNILLQTRVANTSIFKK